MQQINTEIIHIDEKKVLHVFPTLPKALKLGDGVVIDGKYYQVKVPPHWEPTTTTPYYKLVAFVR